MRRSRITTRTELANKTQSNVTFSLDAI